LAKEMNITPDIFVDIHLMSNAPCIAHLKQVLCWYNFPKCNDQNVSLSLCHSSCEQYYKKCKYEPNETDGLYDACREEVVSRRGLLEGDMPGPDQTLGEDTEVCRSTEAAVDALTEAADAEASWWLKAQGLGVVGTGGFLFFGLAIYLLVPEGLRAYALWYMKGIVRWPLERWRRLPTLNGTTCLILLVLTFIFMFIWGMARRFSSGGGFDRFENATNVNVSSYSLGITSSAKEAFSDLKLKVYDTLEASGINFSNLSYTDMLGLGDNATAEDLTTTEAVWMAWSRRLLTTQQTRQLLASCSCTGAASVGAGPSLALSSLLPAVFCLFLAAAGGDSGFRGGW